MTLWTMANPVPATVPADRQRWLKLIEGSAAFILGAFLFAFSTVLIKLISLPPYGLHPMMSVFARFGIGFLATLVWALVGRSDLRPKRIGLVVWRGVLNTAAIMLFYCAVQYTTVTNTNLLNLSYPAWIFLAAPLINREASPWYYGLFLLLTLAGAFLIVVPAASHGNWLRFFTDGFNLGDMMALASGIVAAFGISVLREARKNDSTVTVIFWLFAIGTLASAIPACLVWKNPPDAHAWACLLGAGACGYVGQLLITNGYRWVSASQGSLLSSSGILISAVLGVIFFADPFTVPVLAGGLCILVSLIGVSGILPDRRKSRA
jgi:drug/metabolite transporter (DMT)-like permease